MRSMAQKILIAIDDSENARRAVEFVARSFSPQNAVTLFSVLLDTVALCKMDSPGLTPLFRSQQSNFCALEDKKRDLLTEAVKKGKQILLEAGFAKENIKTKTDVKNRGVARDILDEAENGYDLIVLGRRGLSGIKEFFMGSISQKVINGAGDISVLIVK
jgi:nucleotide-binding universal stress UspA family protein